MLPPAKNLDDMQQVVTNSTVDGVLAAFFAVLIIVVIADAVAGLGARRSGPAPAADDRGARVALAPGRPLRPDRRPPPSARRWQAAAAGNGGNGARERAGEGGAMTAAAAARGRPRVLYLREVAGETAYDRYVEHRRRGTPTSR